MFTLGEKKLERNMAHSVPRDGIFEFYNFLGRLNLFLFLKSRGHFWISAKNALKKIVFYDFIGP